MLLEAEVGSLFLVSLGKNSIIIFQHIEIRGSEGTPDFSTSPWLSIQAFQNKDRDGNFLANHGSFQRACAPISCAANVDARSRDSFIQWRTTQEEETTTANMAKHPAL